jgi:hypothetical protein
MGLNIKELLMEDTCTNTDPNQEQSIFSNLQVQVFMSPVTVRISQQVFMAADCSNACASPA